MSVHFKTNEPNGLLLYLGNEPGRKEDDFMAVEIEKGYPVLTVDLGSGPQRITQ
ncbi:Laminin subunit alpha [Orchesella cincta]|uniref:Laminin subunit alpha n=1 Tax=Orchesella cincta TaxID=48709 RepID=A0A1D2MHT5_ORCCI|nr:Laminin subunit alpha [Orchesella cincta]